jgi:two-component system nitrate/nitrite response regulator NarP
VADVEAGIAIVGGAGALATDALAWMLTTSGSRVLGCYGSVSALESALCGDARTPHVAVVDAEDPAAGPAAVAALRQAYPDLKIMLLCEAVSPTLVSCASEEGVDGVVLKSDTAEEMILALRHLLEGRAVMPAGWHSARLEREQAVRVLSIREGEVLDLVATGLSNKEIAERLVISPNTVKFHLREIYKILGVRTRLQASRAISQRHIDLDDIQSQTRQSGS